MSTRPITREDVDTLTQKLHQAGLIHSCLTCVHFNEKDGPLTTPDYHHDMLPAEHCGLYQIRPPARVIAYGCPSWVDDPF